MRYLGFSILAVLALGVLFAAYVRFVPLGGDRWSKPDVPLQTVGDYPGEKTFIAVRRVVDDAVLSRLDVVALATPGTHLLTEGVDGWTTYVTRTRLMGYPDYTSLRIIRDDQGLLLQIYARSRFGKLDLGVNKARVEDWLGQLDLLTPRG